MAQPSLRRELEFTHATAIVIANMIGTGIFTTTGFLAGDLGRPSLVLGIWVVGAIIAVAGCLCYSEMGVNLPESGGEYIFLREAWGPVWGFLSGWISFFAGFLRADCRRGPRILRVFRPFLPLLRGNGSGSKFRRTAAGWFHTGHGQLVGGGNCGGLFGDQCRGAQTGGQSPKPSYRRSSSACCCSSWVSPLPSATGASAIFRKSPMRTSTHSLPAQFAVSLIFVMFAYSGWNAATYVSGEMKTPERTIPASLVVGTLTVAAFYLLLNVAFIYALPLESMKGVVAIGEASAGALFGAAGRELFQRHHVGGIALVCKRHGDCRAARLFCHGD